MGSRIGRWILAIACLLVVAGAAGAAPPEDVTYQGRLLDSVGDPVAGPVNIEIGIWDQLRGHPALRRDPLGRRPGGRRLQPPAGNRERGGGELRCGSLRRPEPLSRSDRGHRGAGAPSALQLGGLLAAERGVGGGGVCSDRRRCGHGGRESRCVSGPVGARLCHGQSAWCDGGADGRGHAGRSHDQGLHPRGRSPRLTTARPRAFRS